MIYVRLDLSFSEYVDGATSAQMPGSAVVWRNIVILSGLAHQDNVDMERESGSLDCRGAK